MDLRGFWLGVKAAIIASSCCSFPVALVFALGTLGAGSVTAALKVPAYKDYFLAAGTMFLALSLYLRIRAKSGGTCGVGDVKRERNLVAVSLVTYAALTVLLIYAILPVISAWVFGGG
jgi:hypothetical protein